MLKLKTPVAPLKKNEQTMAAARKPARKTRKTSKRKKGCRK